MRILLVNDYAAPVGGAEVRTLALRAALRQRGHDARLFTSHADSDAQAIADYTCFGTTSRYRTLLQTTNPWAAWRLHQTLTEFKPDIVHVRMFLTQLSPLILPLLTEIPCVYHVVWYRPICPVGTKLLPSGAPCQVRAGAVCYQNSCLPLRDWLPLMGQLRLFQRWRHVFRRIITNSHTMRRALEAEGIRPVEVIHNGLPPRSARPPLSDPPTIAFAGRLVREKGADVLLHALVDVVRRQPTVRLLLAGDGPERQALMRLAAELGITAYVDWLGHLSQTELEQRLASAWVQVAPARWAEPFGNVVVEAMLRGTAVVATASGGIPEIVQDGLSGLLVPPGSATALSQALLRLLEDRALAERMGQAGREQALLHFSEDRYIDRIEELYQTMIHEAL